MKFTGVTQGAFQLYDIAVGEPFEQGEHYYLKVQATVEDGEENTLSFNAVDLSSGMLYNFDPETTYVSKVDYQLSFSEYSGESEEGTEE